jgi:hypothetical protein
MRCASVALLCLAGCNPHLGSSFTTTNPAAAPATSKQVELVFSHPNKPYREMGVAVAELSNCIGCESPPRCSPPAANPDYAAMLAELRCVGALHGCDAILVNPTAYARSDVIVSGTCVRYEP